MRDCLGGEGYVGRSLAMHIWLDPLPDDRSADALVYRTRVLFE
jgi:hypothetical protein